ncbi:MAG: phospholipase D-like domain-containing protein [Myxococcota bacterium]|jgi:phosphatidylserine/phosphatidylglycerophosphate/cardiolipin synthase-like enzyme|nr:phospholipase D-like domain-containing protein [Myxococcota bacterium]
MDSVSFLEALTRTLDDGRLSRAERKALLALLSDDGQRDEQSLVALRVRAFQLARAKLYDPRDTQLLNWLEDVIALSLAPHTQASQFEAYFSPGNECRDRIVGLINGARRAIDVAVFTISDDAIARALLDAQQRKVKLRIVSDDEKSQDLGSDIAQFERAGIAVRTDRSAGHMHHKFAIFDETQVLTGSYNWTRSAATQNEENIVVSDDPELREAFQAEFETLWRDCE